jgi:hypothetical protein
MPRLLNVLANSGSVGSSADGYAIMDGVKANPVWWEIDPFNNPDSTITYAGSKVDAFQHGDQSNRPFSIEFWAKPTSTSVMPPAIARLLLQQGSGGANRSGWLFYVNSTGRWNFRLGLTSGYAGNVFPSPNAGAAKVGTWQHIVATYDGSTVNLYADGVLIATASVDAATTGWLPNTQSRRIGASELNGDLSDNPAPAVSATGQGHSGNRWMAGLTRWRFTQRCFPPQRSPHTTPPYQQCRVCVSILADNPLGYWKLDEPAVTAPTQAPSPSSAISGVWEPKRMAPTCGARLRRRAARDMAVWRTKQGRLPRWRERIDRAQRRSGPALLQQHYANGVISRRFRIFTGKSLPFGWMILLETFFGSLAALAERCGRRQLL